MKTFLAIWLAIMTMGSYPTFADDGDLDPTFGRGGIVTTDFSGNWDSALALAVQPDGKIVAVGKGKILEDGQVRPLDVKVGDKILFGKYSGTEVKVDGEELVVMREEDVMAVIEGK